MNLLGESIFSLKEESPEARSAPPPAAPMSRVCEAFHEWYGMLSFLSHVTLLPRILVQ